MKINGKNAGVSVPVFSLRSKNGFGIGEFNDLKRLADWCYSTGLKIIQILPINDTISSLGWQDSYPYKSISVKALNPIYLNLGTMGKLSDENDRLFFEKKQNELNDKDFVDYPEVLKLKMLFFKKIYFQEWEKIKETIEYQLFYRENETWLKQYAAFCTLRDTFGTADYKKWNENSIYDQEAIDKFCESKDTEVSFYYFLQYHADKQLSEAVAYLHSKGVALKGDIPIGISPHSVEAWTEPQLFKIGNQAGAPPDAFAEKGQNWGFPTYNWEAMAADGYRWWRDRLLQMSRYFDAYRIDHILGFFRIWEIPQDATQGVLGRFCPALPLSKAELQSQALDFEEERMTKPYIRGHFLIDFFGPFVEEARHEYLEEKGFDVFSLKDNFNTQRKIEDYFREKSPELGEKDKIIRDGLLNLVAEVLFIKDSYSDGWHPRIALQFTHSYNELSENQKYTINNIYNDFFYKRHNDFWKEEALKKLPAIIHSGDMLVCGEDLGMVPDCVSEVMQQLGILSLEVQRMPKKLGQAFVNPAENHYLSVDTTSTHDMPTLRGWWEENSENTNKFYHEMLGYEGVAPFFAEPYICKEIVRQHLGASSMLVILPIQDYIAMNGAMRWDQTWREQINDPANPDNHWCYRMKQDLEEIIENTEFNETLRELVKIRCEKSNNNKSIETK